MGESSLGASRRRDDVAGVKLEVLYLDGCPSNDRLLPCLRELAIGHSVELQRHRIDTPEQAVQTRFLGSPSVRVDGVDVEPGAQARTDFGLKCRLYRGPDGQSRQPPTEWIERALRETAARR